MQNFAVIRHYRFDKKNSDQIDQKVKDVFMPLLKECKGFVHYYWIDSGLGEGASVSIFRSKAEGEASNVLAAEFVRRNLEGLITQKPEIIEGYISADN